MQELWHHICREAGNEVDVAIGRWLNHEGGKNGFTCQPPWLGRVVEEGGQLDFGHILRHHWKNCGTILQKNFFENSQGHQCSELQKLYQLKWSYKLLIKLDQMINWSKSLYLYKRLDSVQLYMVIFHHREAEWIFQLYKRYRNFFVEGSPQYNISVQRKKNF